LSLQPTASTEVVVTFKPEAERVFSAQLVVASNDADMPSVVVPMSGRGVRQQVLLSESSLEFGQQLIHHTSSPRKVRVINNSDSPVTLTALTVEGTESSRFKPDRLALPLSIAPGQQQEVGVAFAPLSESEVNGMLKLFFGELPQPLAVALQGKGIPTVLSIRPSSLDFGGVRVGSSKREQPLTLTNLSSDPIILAPPEVTDATGEPFTYDGASLQGRQLEPGMSVILAVGYQPQVESPSATTLSFGTTTPPRPRAVEVQLKGRAMQHLLSVNTSRVDFGQVRTGVSAEPKAITITNHSSQQQRVVVMLKSLEGTPFSVETQALANPLAPGGTATFSVAFNPQTPGDFQNEAQLWLQGSTSPEVLVPMTGSRADEELPPGCSCGSSEAGSAGMLALLALVGLGSRRRRHA
jgi:MYXO-CTERM domain-containing protein